MSSRVRPKLGTQSCAPTPCRSAVSRSSRAKRGTNASAEPSQCFQYGSVTSVLKPSSDATSFQSASPCVPSVEGNRQIAFVPPRSDTCASISRKKPTTDASRKACTSGVRSAGLGLQKGSAQRSQRQVKRAGSSTPTCTGTTHAGSSQKTESTPHSSTQSAHSLQKSR